MKSIIGIFLELRQIQYNNMYSDNIMIYTTYVYAQLYLMYLLAYVCVSARVRVCVYES